MAEVRIVLINVISAPGTIFKRQGKVSGTELHVQFWIPSLSQFQIKIPGAPKVRDLSLFIH